MLAMLALLIACSPDKAPSAQGDDTAVEDANDTATGDDTSQDSGGSGGTPPPRHEQDCHNGEDDDQDGLIDCEDADCISACAEDCDNGVDDDDDGLIDCEDDDCTVDAACWPDPTPYTFTALQGHAWHKERIGKMSSSSGLFTFYIDSGSVVNSEDVRCTWTGVGRWSFTFVTMVSSSDHYRNQFNSVTLSDDCPLPVGGSALAASFIQFRPQGNSFWRLKGLAGGSYSQTVYFAGSMTNSAQHHGTSGTRSSSFSLTLTNTPTWTVNLPVPLR